MAESLRIASWNINSIRPRLHCVEQFAADCKPDVLCLQEIKVVEELFPAVELRRMGFVHQAVFGQKGYHGVAILAKERVPLDKVTRREWCDIVDARHLHCLLPGGIELHNFYVPAGGDVPDRDLNEKFDHKLRFITDVAAWFKSRKRKTNRFMLLGDLNVAPLETDVWNHKQLLKVVSHTPIEIAHMQTWYESHDWVDAVRRFIPPEEKVYSWWSYRAKDWSAADKGRRLDHIWVTPALAPALRAASIHRQARGYDKASDHAPAIVDVAI